MDDDLANAFGGDETPAPQPTAPREEAKPSEPGAKEQKAAERSEAGGNTTGRAPQAAQTSQTAQVVSDHALDPSYDTEGAVRSVGS